MDQGVRYSSATGKGRRLAFRGYDAGLGNYKMSMDAGIALAYLDQRTLVPFGLTTPWRSTRPRVAPEFARCIGSPFDLFEIPVPVDLSHIAEASRLPGTLCNWPRLYESVCHFLAPQELSVNEHFASFRNGRPRTVTLDQGMRTAPVLVVDTLTLTAWEYFFYLEGARARELAAVMSAVKPHAAYRDLARRFAAAVGPYNAVHIRRGDFVTHSYTPRSGQVSCEEIGSNLQQILDSDMPLALCTDAEDLSFFAPLLKLFPRTFVLEQELLHNCAWRARFDELPFNDDHAFSVVVQQIASLAETFVGTLFSSFTSEIQRARGTAGDLRFLFCYNDWPEHPRVRFEKCEFLPTARGSFSWNQIAVPVDPCAYSWMRVWPEAFYGLETGQESQPDGGT